MLRSYINEVFINYDKDQSGTLDPNQMTNFFNDLFKSLGIPMVITQKQAMESIRSIDSNFDGKIDKE